MKKQVGITRQKNEFLSVSVRSILISFIIFSASCFDLSAQQSSGKVPYQVSKGKWMINNDFFYTGYFTEKNTSYDGNDNKTGRDKTGKFYSSISLISPSWGGLGINSGNTYKFDANDNELEKVDASNWSINITPSIGYFIQDRLLLGANILLYFGSDKSNYHSSAGSQIHDYKYTTVGVGIGPEMRYYFGDLKNKQLFHAGIWGNVNYRTGRQSSIYLSSNPNNTTTTTYKTRQPGFSVRPYVGSSWFAGKRWTFEASLLYLTSSSNYKLKTTENNAVTETRVKTTRSDIGLKAGANFTF